MCCSPGTGAAAAVVSIAAVGETRKKQGRIGWISESSPQGCSGFSSGTLFIVKPTFINVTLGNVSWVCQASHSTKPSGLHQPPESLQATCERLPSVTGDISPGVTRGGQQ